jgi:NADH:ubiquinone oxidoreductase subunit 5 (subunit L)/multisubunit Na+/H+ antiporter MnhA subunit
MLTLILLLPLIGFFGASVFGRFLGKGACYLTFFNTFFSFCLSAITFYKVVYLGSSYRIVLTSWLY